MKNILKKNKNEIIWNLINSGIAGVLVFLGALSTGNLTIQSLILAFVAALVVAFTKFRDYWATQEKEYKVGIFNFV